MRNTDTSSIAGVLPVIKPIGPTSHDVVQMARRALKMRAIGHTGTLDPAAAGLLLLCLGPYTKLVPYLTESSKTYTGHIGLGLETTTDDCEGEPTLVGDAGQATPERVRAQGARFVGDIEQMPPKYAAIKVAGKKLYEYARENVEVKVDPRPVTVYSFDIGEVVTSVAPAAILARRTDASSGTPAEGAFKLASFITKVSSGTYVRALARDLGRELGCGGYLADLARTAVGKFSAADAMSLDQLQENPELAEKYLCRGAAALDSDRFPILVIVRGFIERLMRGQPVHEKMLEHPEDAANLASGAVVGIASDTGALLAVMEAERFDTQARQNAYVSKYAIHFKPLRIFPGGLQ